MALTYDFDIRRIEHSEPSEDVGQMLPESRDADENLNLHGFVALFRDPQTVEVLRGADARLRSLLGLSGFGMGVYDSGAGPMRYPAADEAERLDVINKLSKNLKEADLKGADLNGFDFLAFLKSAVEARPTDDVRPKARVPAPKVAEKPTPTSGIDAAFANPKSGTPITPNDNSALTLDDLMSGPIHASVLASPEFAAGDLAEDDLTYRPTTFSEPKGKSGISFVPIMMIGMVVVFVFVFWVLGDSGASSIVSR